MKNPFRYSRHPRDHPPRGDDVVGEAFVRINGEIHYLWRAVDHEGEVLDAVVTKKRDRKAARKVLKRLLQRYGRPRTIVTDRLRSYQAALRDIGRGARHETGRWPTFEPKMHISR